MQTRMMITLDNLSTRYHLLPSEVLDRATTFDLEVCDTACRWQQHQVQQQDAPRNPTQPGIEQLQAMMDRVKKRAQ